MNLSEKLRHLRLVEGQLRGLGRPLTQAETVRLMRGEVGEAVSQSYLSQLEAGSRIHLSAGSRDLLAGFYKVHPGYLVADPPGYEGGLPEPGSRAEPRDLGSWLERIAEDSRDDPLLYHVLLRLARQPDPRRWLLLLDELLEQPNEVRAPATWASELGADLRSR